MKSLINPEQIKKSLRLMRFLLPALLILFSKPAWSGQPIKISLDAVLLFESAENVPDKQDREYKNFFDPKTQYINIELNVNNLNYNVSQQEYDVTFVWKYLNDSEFGKSQEKFTVQPDWQTAYIYRGWGFKGVGKWPEGLFTAQIFINDSLFAEKDFYITTQATSFKTLTNTNKPIAELKNSTEINSYKIYRQIQIPEFFNTHYAFDISKTGEDISFLLGRHMVHKTNGSSIVTTRTTNEVFLFRDNKQILPPYYNILPRFDDNLENLFYSKYVLNSNNAGNYQLNRWHGYYNGAEIYKSLIDARIYFSTINGQMAYILGQNNSAFQRGMGLQIIPNYEYLVVDQNTLQPECLVNSKRVKITDPVVFKLNSDSTQSVIYTAEFKEGKKNQYALFNEDKMISDKYNGHISKPYLSTDKKHVACVVKNDDEFFITVDGIKTTKAYANIKDEYIYCDQHKNVVFQAEIDEKWYIIKNDEAISEGFEETGYTIVNEKTYDVFYKAKRDEKWSIYNNKDKVSPDFDDVGDEICVSPKSSKIAYAAANGNVMFVMVNDEKISPDFELRRQLDFLSKEGALAITNLTFNDPSDKLAYKVTYNYTDRFSGSLYNKTPNSYVMINNEQISPKMYDISILSNNADELIIVGVDVADLIIHHFKVDF